MSPRQVLTIPDVPPTLLTQSAGDARYLTPAAAAAAYLPLTGGTLTGNLLVNPGNTYNLGASGSGRWGTVYGERVDVAQYLALGTNPATAGLIRSTYDFGFEWKNNDGTQNAFLKFGAASGSPNYLNFGYAGVGKFVISGPTGNVGVGVTPPAWGPSQRAIQIGQAGALVSNTTDTTIEIKSNSYMDGTNNRAIVTGIGKVYSVSPSSGFSWYHQPSVAAGAVQTVFTRHMFLDNNGTLVMTPEANMPSFVTSYLAAVGDAPVGTDWNAGLAQLKVGGLGVVWANAGNGGDPNSGTAALVHNARYAGAGITLINTGRCGFFQIGFNGVHRWYTSASGNAGTVPALTQHMELGATGMLNLSPDAGVRALTANGEVIVGGGKSIMLAEATNNYYVGWRSGATGVMTMSYWGGDTGVTIDTGGIFKGTQFQAISGNHLYLKTPTSYVFLDAGGNVLMGERDNTCHWGYSDHRWVALYATTGTIQTSSVEAKTDIAPLDPAACASAVLETDWTSFAYLDPVAPGRDAETDDRAWDEQQALYQRQVVETAHTRRQNGYILGSPDHRVHDLFGLADRKSKNNGADLAVVACALQDALKRIAQLEATRA